MSNIEPKVRTKEEIRELKRIDPFFAFRNMKSHQLTDEQLYDMFSFFNLDEWEIENMNNYMARRMIEQSILED